MSRKAAELGFGGGGAFVAAFAGLEAVDEAEGDVAPVVALALVDKHSIGVHRPVVVGSIEYIIGFEL